MTFEKIEGKSAVIGILGLGYVGLPLMLRFIEVGIKVIGIDIDKSKVDALRRGESYIAHIRSEKLVEALKKGFVPTTDFSQAAQCDALIICVPTPLNDYREPDLSYVLDTARSIAPYLKTGQIVSLESTTYPGTTDEDLRPIIESKGLKAGKDLALVFSPEREDPGNPSFKTQTIPKVVGGFTAECLKLGVKLYSLVVDQVVPVSSTRVAEMTKLLENIHRSVNIGLVNEMKMVADVMGIDIFEVVKAAATKPFGFTPYFPGPGLGGHCIPIDPFYLTWKAREYGINTKFIELAGEVNTHMPDWVVSKIQLALNKAKKSVSGSKILVLGLSYKKNIDDYRESPSLKIIKRLNQLGAVVDYSDPWVPGYNMSELNSKVSIKLTNSTLSSYDLVTIITNHDDFPYHDIQRSAKMIVDTRGVYSKLDEKTFRA
jgi:UDP-N-acetyl-D-glucosamine dehydrogenase